jgi:hypothetical protein
MRLPLKVSGVVSAMMLALASCGGEDVALNERLFATGSMEQQGGGCYLLALGDGSRFSSEWGSAAGGLSVKLHTVGDDVAVSVHEGDRLLTQHQYGESFFRSGAVDEFIALPSSGGDGLLLRYWGKVHPGGTAGCAPLDQLAPQ